VDVEASILVVDDEMGIREGCKRALSEEGYLVECAEDGNLCLQKAKKKPYDLILVDLMMPSMGGLDLIQKIHEIDPEIIMIVITGYASIDTAVEATKRGAYDYLPKPFSPEALSAVVKRGLEKRWLRLEAQKLYSERDQKLLELASEQSRLKTIVGCMADGVLVTNMEGCLVLWNASSVKMLNLKSHEVSGEALAYYIKNKDIIDSIQGVLSSKDEEVSKINREIEVDNMMTLMAINAPVKDEEGQILGAVTVLRDITQLKEIEKIKSQFVSMVAHELRAPVAAIEGWLEILLSGELGEDEKQRKKWLGRAKDRAHSLLIMVNDLLEINRMEAGRVAQKMETVDLSQIIQKIVDFVKPEVDKRNITISLKLPSNMPSVQADVKDMEKLFTNLINNAIKYNKKEGTVTVEGEMEGNFLCIRITDTGFGISPENQSKIFDDFYRVEDDKTKKITGTGLGLTISKKIIDSHFGRIEVQSQLNEGSTFSVYLPLSKKKDGEE